MGLLRLLVMLGMGLLLVSLLYVQVHTSSLEHTPSSRSLPRTVRPGPQHGLLPTPLCARVCVMQFATAIIAPRGIVGSLEEPTNAAAQAAATAPLVPDLRQQLPTARPGGDQPTTAPAPAGGFPAPHLTHLVLVAGHAVYTGLDFAVANMESSWFLEAYQQVSVPGSSNRHRRVGREVNAAYKAGHSVRKLL